MITSFLAQMPGFESGWPSATAAAATETPLKISNLTAVQLAGTALFAWAFVQHHRLLKKLGRSRTKCSYFFFSCAHVRTNLTFAKMKRESGDKGYAMPRGKVANSFAHMVLIYIFSS